MKLSADLQFDKVVDMRTVKLINNDMTQVVISYNYYGADHNSLSIQVLGYDPEKEVKTILFDGYSKCRVRC